MGDHSEFPTRRFCDEGGRAKRAREGARSEEMSKMLLVIFLGGMLLSLRSSLTCLRVSHTGASRVPG